METNTAYSLARGLMDKYGLQDWRFEFNNRKGSYGLCSYYRKTIFLSSHHVQMGVDDDIKDTILHEIAHALTFKKYNFRVKPHGPEWRHMAISIGCSGKRCGTGALPNTVKRILYKGTCGKCGHVYKRHRLRLRILQSARCNCGGELSWQKYNLIPTESVRQSLSEDPVIKQQQIQAVLNKLTDQERAILGLPLRNQTV